MIGTVHFVMQMEWNDVRFIVSERECAGIVFVLQRVAAAVHMGYCSDEWTNFWGMKLQESE